MKHKRFSDEQVIGVLNEHEAGAKVDDICGRHAITTLTLAGLPIEAALTATLLFRGLSLWIPPIPGFFISQRELGSKGARIRP